MKWYKTSLYIPKKVVEQIEKSHNEGKDIFKQVDDLVEILNVDFGMAETYVAEYWKKTTRSK